MLAESGAARRSMTLSSMIPQSWARAWIADMIGKKNWLFFGEAETGQRSTVIYTIIESWRRHGIEPREYMRDVLTRIIETSSWQVADLTPEKWVDKKLSLKKAT